MAETFRQALEAAGLVPGEIVPDGRWRRCKTLDKPRHRNGAYVMYPDGHGLWRNWATDSSVNVWRDAGYTTAARPIDQKRLEAIRARERQRRIDGIRHARAVWGEARPYRHHQYLIDKGLRAEGCAGLRVWTGTIWTDQSSRVHDTWLCVPMFWRGSMVNVQRIGTKGLKRFVGGAPSKAASFVIERERAALTVIAEGLATGLAVYQCMRHARVVVAFDAGNLLPVIEELKPTGMVVIAADNDHVTASKAHMNGVNPGIEKARNAASLIDCGVAYPEGIEGSDWADALREHGPTYAKKLERAIQAEARYVRRTTKEPSG